MEYEVKKGDGWYKIAKNLGVNVNDLLQANNAKLDTMLQPGLRLKTRKSELPVGISNVWGVDKSKEWANQQTKRNEQMLKTAEENAEKDYKARKDVIYLGQPDKTYQEVLSKDRILTLQQLLRTLGYDIGKTGADGLIGINTKKALAAAEKAGYSLVNGKLIAPNKENYIKSNSPYALAHRALIGNIYPYDYNPDITLDKNNIEGYNEFLTLDLNTPEGIAKAKEIRTRKQLDGKPLFSNRGISDNKKLQKQFRERHDLLLLNSGQPLQFNSFLLYTDLDGNIYYQFTDSEINKQYADAALASRKAYTVKDDGNIVAYRDGVIDEEGNPVEYIPRDLTNALFNLYKLLSRKDDFGNYTLAKDSWNLAPFEKLPGNSITPTIRIRSYDDYHMPKNNNAEDMIIENSVYDKQSVRLNDKVLPRKVKFSEPLSLDFIIENGKKYLKNRF